VLFFSLVGICAVAAIGYLIRPLIFSDRSPVAAGPQATVQEDEEAAPADVVVLTDTEVAAAAIQVDRVEQRMLHATRTVPGRIGYDENHYLPVTSPVRGVVRSVHVLPGQQVQQGDLLAVVSSAEIGMARSEVLLRQQQMELATQQYEWEDQILQNLQSLLERLQERPSMDEVSQAFSGKLLGDHRSDVLTAYANLLLAESTATRTDPLAKQGVVSGSVVQQRRSAREVAATAFQSVCEQTRLSCLEDRNRAQAELNDARRRLVVSQQHLSALCGSESAGGEVDETALNDLQLRAPIAGQITRKEVVPAARVDVADTLFVLADMSSLWVSAQLREQDWGTVQAVTGERVFVQVPAVGEAQLSATIRFVGAEVSPETRALPMVAELENLEFTLRPGLFAWISVPAEDDRQCVAVAPAAIQRHDEQPFVFVQLAPGRYQRRNVELGLVSPQWTEIRSGLEVGEQVVVYGAFCLKSELLLEGEE
jgi:RND family efflux transporter MFP subunit